jgi:hypothetical protein
MKKKNKRIRDLAQRLPTYRKQKTLSTYSIKEIKAWLNWLSTEFYNVGVHGDWSETPDPETVIDDSVMGIEAWKKQSKTK